MNWRQKDLERQIKKLSYNEQVSIKNANLLKELSLLHAAKGNYTEANRLLTKQLELEEQLLSSDLGKLVSHFQETMDTHLNQDNFSGAELILRRLDEYLTRQKPQNKLLLAKVKNELGELYLFDSKLHGKYSDQEAIKCFNEAKFFLQGKDCPSKLELANTLCNIASYEEESVLSQWNALSNYEKALEIYKRYEGSQSIDYANTLILMANLYSENFGQFETAKSLYYEAILIANRDDNIVSRRLIIGLLRLADGLYSRGRTQEAQEVFRTTYALCRKNLAPNSELYRKTIEQFANFETGAGNLSAGLALFEEYDRAMKQHRANVPIGNYREIAIVYALNGKYIQAEAICRREIDGITAGNYVTEKMLAAATLAFIQNRQGNYKLALSSLQRAYSGRLDKYHLVASYLLQQSIANICLANYEESYRILKRAGNAQFVVASTRNQSKFLIDVYLELVKQIRADRYDLQEFLNIELKYRKAHPKDFGTASFFIKQTDFKAPYSLKEYGQIYFLMHRQLFYQVLEKVGVQQKLGL